MSARQSTLHAPPRISKFRNVYSSSTGKALYLNVRVDPVATNKFKANESFIAIPGINATSIGILPLPTSRYIQLIDAAACQLAGCDATIKMWDTEALEDRISLNVPGGDTTTTQSLVFDYEGVHLASSTSEAMIHLYDPRASVDATHTVFAEHSPSKGCRISWLHPDPFLASVGFHKSGKNERWIHLWDIRMFETPVQTVLVDGSGVGVFTPTWDTALPLLYLTTRGEGIRVLELDDGVLQMITTLKIDKHAAAVDLMPKTVCDTKKCEIARFLRLGYVYDAWDGSGFIYATSDLIRTDNAVEMTSIYVPRVNSETVFQEDLYPFVASANRDANASQWFDSTSIVEPWMIDASGAVVSKSQVVDESKATLMTAASVNRTAGSVSRHGKDLSFTATPEVRESIAASVEDDEPEQEQQIKEISGVLSLEHKGWFGTTWEPLFLTVKSSRLYIAADQNQDSPMRFIKLSAIRNVTAFSFDANDDTGIQFEVIGQPLQRYQAESKEQRD
eukprot:jgi/Hompol1/1852/HPOL_005747-RA